MDEIVSKNILLSSGVLESETGFWNKMLTPEISLPHISPVSAKTGLNDGDSAGYKFSFDEKLSLEINKMANSSPFGVYLLLLSGIYYILHRYSGQKDILIGTPVFKQDDDSNLLNYILPLRLQVDKDISFRDLLMASKKTVGDANENMNFPFEKMLEIANIPENNGHKSMFNVFVRFNPIHHDNISKDLFAGLNFTFDQSNNTINCVLKYSTKHYDELYISTLADNLSIFFSSVLNNKAIRLESILLSLPGVVTDNKEANQNYSLSNLLPGQKEASGEGSPATALKKGQAAGLEQQLIKIWQNVLAKTNIDVSTNFFDLGGDSLKAMRVVSRLQKMGCEISLNTLYTSSIKQIVDILGKPEEKSAGRVDTIEKAVETIKNEFNLEAQFVEYVENAQKYNVLCLKSGERSFDRENLIKTIYSRLNETICPHFIAGPEENIPDLPETISPEVFAGLMSFNKGAEEDIISSVIDDLCRQETEFINDITSGQVVQTFPVSAIQKGTVGLNKHNLGIINSFYLPVGEQVFIRALQNLISGQQLLRSVLIHDNEELYWLEHKNPDKITIPYVDISGYDFKVKENIIKSVVAQKYYQSYFTYNSIPYRFFLIKENLKKYTLIAPFEHIIFDGMSAEVVLKGIKEYLLTEKQDKPKTVKRYSDYVSQLKYGPVDITMEELITKLNLPEFEKYKEKVEGYIVANSKGGLFGFDYKISLGDKKINEEKIWEESFTYSMLICQWIFNLPKIPVKLLYYGRGYLDNNYNNNVGYFNDLIPVLVPTDENNIDNIALPVTEAINIAKKHNVNFASLNFFSDLEAKWHKLNQYCVPDKLKETDQMLVYNFQGKRNDIEHVGDLLKEGKKDLDNYRLQTASFSIISYYTDSHLHFNIISAFELDTNELKGKLDKKIQAERMHDKKIEKLQFLLKR